MDKILRLLVGIITMAILTIKNPPLTSQVVIIIVLSGCLIITAYLKDIKDNIKPE